MRLDVIGAGPAYTDRPGATGAAYLLRYAGASLLLDLGQGSFPRLAGLIDPAELDAAVISHLHPDHFIDLSRFVTTCVGRSRAGASGSWARTRSEPALTPFTVRPGSAPPRLISRDSSKGGARSAPSSSRWPG